MKKTLAAVLLLTLSAPFSAKAEMPSLFGIGHRSMSMGGAALNQGQYSSYQVYTAPAALGYLRRVEFSFGMQQFDPKIKGVGLVRVNSAGTQGDFRDSGVLGGGGSLISFGLPLGTQRPLTLGGAIYLPFTSMIRISGTPVDYPFYPLYTDISRNFFFVVGAGYEFVDGWAFGINFRSTTKSTVNYALRSDNSVNYSASATEAKSESRLSYSLIYDHGRRNPEKPWSMGLMYRGKSGMETKIQADVSAFAAVQGELNSMPSYTPAEIVLMGSFRARQWTFTGDISRVQWSDYQSPYGSGNINSYVIGERASKASFKDITVFRYGMQQEFPMRAKLLKKLTLREGYQFHPSPVPDQTGDSNFLDNDRHMFSGGLGFTLPSPLRENDTLDIDLFFQYNWLKKRTVVKDTSTRVGAPGYETSGSILLYGLGTTLRF
jgi:long-chain fatty acid transport protein